MVSLRMWHEVQPHFYICNVIKFSSCLLEIQFVLHLSFNVFGYLSTKYVRATQFYDQNHPLKMEICNMPCCCVLYLYLYFFIHLRIQVCKWILSAGNDKKNGANALNHLHFRNLISLKHSLTHTHTQMIHPNTLTATRKTFPE